MQPLTVQVSCAFWDDGVRVFFEPHAPPVSDRLEAVGKLTSLGLKVDLRIDPLFPSERVAPPVRKHAPLGSYGLPEAQSAEDLGSLARFAKSAGVHAVVASPLKVSISDKAQRCKDWFRQLYSDANLGEGKRRGNKWRLPRACENALLESVREICAGEGVPVKHCLHDVLHRR